MSSNSISEEILSKSKKPFFSSDLTGDLFIHEIYVFYNAPQVFTCKNFFGQLYIITYADSDNFTDTWFGNPISRARLEFLKRRKICLFDAITCPEDNSKNVYKIQSFVEGEKDVCTRVPAGEIDTNLLPDMDYYLNIDIEELPSFHSISPSDACEIRRDIVFLSFANTAHKKEIYAATLGAALKEVQNAVTFLSAKNNNLRGKIPNDIRDSSILEATGTAAASFGVYLKSKETSDLLGQTPVTESLKLLAEIISASDDETKLKNALSNKNPRTAASILKLFRTIFSDGLSLNFELATVDCTYRYVKIDRESISTRISNLSRRIDQTVEFHEYAGVMTAIDTNNSTFTFDPDSEEYQISGKISYESKEPFTVTIRYKIQVEERLSIAEATGSEKVLYSMIAAERIDNENLLQ